MSEPSPKDPRSGERLFLAFSPIKGAQSRALRFYNVYIQRPTMTASDGHRILSLLPPCTLMTTRNRPLPHENEGADTGAEERVPEFAVRAWGRWADGTERATDEEERVPAKEEFAPSIGEGYP